MYNFLLSETVFCPITVSRHVGTALFKQLSQQRLLLLAGNTSVALLHTDIML